MSRETIAYDRNEQLSIKVFSSLTKLWPAATARRTVGCARPRDLRPAV